MAESAAKKAKRERKEGLILGFRHFISGYGIVPLAIGVVIGNAVNDLVKALVTDLISPLISLVSPQGRLQGFQMTIHGSVFHIGHAINAIISFLVIALLVYFGARVILRNEELLKKK